MIKMEDLLKHSKMEEDMVPRNISYIRNTTGMNIKDFAEYIKVPYRTYQNWENGERTCADYMLRLVDYKVRMDHKNIFETVHDIYTQYFIENEEGIVAVEVYQGEKLHSNDCKLQEWKTLNRMSLVKDWDIVDEEEYNNSICANAEPSDFAKCYNDKNAKVLLILISTNNL